MIIICEPIARGTTHEKFNSGFIYGLRLAYPHEKIRFYADITHIEAIKKIMDHDKIMIEDIEYVPVKFKGLYGIRGILTYSSLFNKILSDAIEAKVNKIFFLSFNPTILYVIKKLKRKIKFNKMKFTFVLHGSFETIANGYDKPTQLSLPIRKIKNQNDVKYKLQIIRQTKLTELPMVISPFIDRFMPWHWTYKRIFTDRRMLQWNHSPDYRYIALAPHIKRNAEKYIDIKKLNMYTVVLPTVFKEPSAQPDNEYVKFAIFGYGNPLVLHNILVQLSQKDIKRQYEIRIIGMDNRGTAGFPNVTCPSPGKRLDRSEMEKYAEDIDIFLILYDKTRYRLSCTGSILESLSYTKPILHFDNDCINTFNMPDGPIGICCDSLEEFVCKMEDIIENYEAYRLEFQNFRKNILKLRKECAIENSVATIKESFTW
ncbi:hypothetical protein [Methanomethylovorans sp.]|uniref:hypothetical protein n=3 Tax=Methanomethylovorans sp. TaxID=2758717 RepID=UPI001BD4D494|nr:hypothetical protein [Methanomethylovorans sp.]